MGRSKLKTLKETTLNSFFDVAGKLGISNQFNFNAQSNVINFKNGSEIILKDLFLYPSDPNFDSLGSLEITGAFIDECNQLSYKAWQVTKSRIRYKLSEWDISGIATNDLKVHEYNDKGVPVSWVLPNGSITKGLIPKMLGTCNPSKNWVYKNFYHATKDGTIENYRKFVQALPTDNPFLPESYIKSLLELDENSKQRLYYGNWEYDNDPTALINYSSIQRLFKNKELEGGDWFITADIARFGRDATVIGLWCGFRLERIITIDKNKITEAADVIKKLAVEYNISMRNVIVDEDGLGGGVVDILGCNGFMNNSKPLVNPNTGMDENYQNLKSQMYFNLARVINNGKMYVFADDTTRDFIVQELEQVKQFNADKDGKKQVVPKDVVKDLLGRSPDYSDMLMMRMWFVYRRVREISFGW